MLPFLGRFFSAPRQTSDLRDIVITVTPHIIRSAALEQEDHLARQGVAQQSGLTLSVEEVVRRAELEDERDHRLNATARPRMKRTLSDCSPRSCPSTSSR